jgi:hypothetical protein
MMIITIKECEKDNHGGEEKGEGYSIEEELKKRNSSGRKSQTHRKEL